MSNKKLVILGLVAAVMVVWATVQSRVSNKPSSQPPGPVYLIQGLNPDDIGSIVLQVKENTMTLKRVGAGFVITDKDNYPANIRNVNELITRCLDIKTLELYTDDKSSHKDLAVTEADARTVVKFFKPDSSLLTGVVIGDSKAESGVTYVRLVSSDNVYVTLDRPYFTDRLMSYINPVLTRVNESDVVSVIVSDSNGIYNLKKDGNDIVLENSPAGKKLKAKESRNVFAALENLKFEDVEKESTIEGLDYERRYVCRVKNSTIYILKIAQKDGKTRIACSAEFADKTEVTKANKVETEEELKQKEAKLFARDKAKEFAAKHKGWVYAIPQYNAGHLTMRLLELLEDEQPEQAGDPNLSQGQQ